MLDRIPEELRALPQWVSVGENKVPINPRTGQLASPTSRDTWGTFEEARQRSNKVGFVLTHADPYTIIDLDNKPEAPASEEALKRHSKILEAFDSYTERSQSGTGYHIIVKGTIPKGVHRDHVEVYSAQRYMVCTGDVVRDTAITEQQYLLDRLYSEMKPAERVELEQIDSDVSDSDIVDMATCATNGDKFVALCEGRWQELGYPSQSEADFALMDIIAFYTKDNEQVRRIFRLSQLGRREKAQRNDRYLNYCLEKIRAEELPAVDLSHFKVEVPDDYDPDTEEVTHRQAITLPAGLLGEVTQYIYSSSVRPVPEVALAGAIAFMAGITGRSYNISGMGLNQYVILLAGTGTGKEGAKSGIDRIVSTLRQQVPAIDQFQGPGVFASGQALIKVLDTKPCFFSVLGEFGLTLQQMCEARANSAQVMLRRVLLDLYGKSGHASLLQGSVYSDSDKNTKMVAAPNLTILGEATPQSFYDGLSRDMIGEGLIPRFSFIHYTGLRPRRNPHAGHGLDPGLAQRLMNLVQTCLQTQANNTVCQVQTDQHAQAMLDQFDRECDDHINSQRGAVSAQLWNRAHLKALKMAGLIAVGRDPHNPIVTMQDAQWAVDFVVRDVNAVMAAFKDGGTSKVDEENDMDDAEAAVRSAVDAYLRMGKAQRQRYKTPDALLGAAVVPYNYIRRRLRGLAQFKRDPRGRARAIQDAMEQLVDADVLQLVDPKEARVQFGIKQALYIPGPSW